MEKLYRKGENGRYYPVGFGGSPDISDGIWFVNSGRYSKSMTNAAWRVGDIPKLVDITTHAALQAMENELSQYVLKLTQEDSDEYKEAKEMYGNWIKGPLGIHEFAISELVSLFLRKIAIKLDSE